MRTYLSIPAILVAGLTACSGGGGGGRDNPALGGSPRAFTRTDSAVTALPNTSGGYTATRVVTLSNDDAGASAAIVSLANPVGSIASSVSSGGYQVQVALRADAPTELQARAALATMTVEHRDAVGGSTLYLNNEVKFGSYSANNVNRSAEVTAALPGALDYRLYEGIGVGTLGSTGLSGSEVELDDGTGSASLSGTWDRATVGTGTGNVTISGDIAFLQAATGTGSVQATLPATRNTQATLDSGTGNIDAAVTRTAGSGFDLIAQTHTGTATVVVAGTEPVGPQSSASAHYRSANYASSNPQVSITARTSTGSVLIHE